MDIVERALEIATEAHAGQTRWDGTAYIEHPKSVMLIVRDSWIDPFAKWMIPISLVAAIFHDVAEDTTRTELDLVRQLEDEGYLQAGSIHSAALLRALKLLNKNNHTDYLAFVLAVKEDLIARKVKIADIKHNLSDLKAGKMRDKYLLALYILEH